MRINIYDLYKESLDIINEEERGQIAIPRWERSADAAIKDFIDFLTGRIQEEPQPRLGIFKNQKITDLLSPIIGREMVPYTNALVTFPKTYNHFIDMRISGDPQWKPMECKTLPRFTIAQVMNGQGGFRQVKVMSHDKIPSYVNSSIPLLKNKLVAEQYEDGFIIYNAKQLNGSAFMVFLREPENVKLNMTTNPNTMMLEYTEAGSVHPPFDKKVSPFLARKIAQYYFNFTREEQAIGSSDAVAKTE